MRAARQGLHLVPCSSPRGHPCATIVIVEPAKPDKPSVASCSGWSRPSRLRRWARGPVLTTPARDACELGGRDGETARLCRTKKLLVDHISTLMGSYNWTRNAARNSEDLNLVASRAVAAAYAAQWGTRQALSVPFVGREDWCRPRHARNSLDGAG